jgi:transposase-like protein
MGHVPSDETAGKPIDIFLPKIRKKWEMPPITRKVAASQFAIKFAESLSPPSQTKSNERVESFFQRLE